MDHVLHVALLAVALAAVLLAPPALAAVIVVVSIGVGVATLSAVSRASRLPPRVGNESVAGGRGVVVEWGRSSGLVRHRGELWQATSTAPLRPREPVRILRAEGTMLHVHPERG